MQLQTTAVATGGEAIAREPSGRVVFVAGALAGESVTVEMVEERRDYARARVLDVVVASPDRVAPPCPNVAAGCGGCDLQHVAPAAQLALKRTIVADTLARIARLDMPPVRTVALPLSAYRTSVRGQADGGRFALRRHHSHDTLALGHCLVAHPLLDELIHDGRFGAAASVTLRCGARTGERLVVVGPTAADVVVPADVRVVGIDELRQGRRAWIHEEIDGRRFRISAQSFFQARPDGAEALVAAVRAEAGPLDAGATVVDLFAGVGLFAATVAPDAAVVAVERSASAAADARVNLHGRRAQIIRRDVESWRPTPAAVVVADPARAGLGRAGADRVAATGAARVVLVSCDPAAFARDAALLRDRGYALRACTLVDLFGHTAHVELVSRFEQA